MAIMAKDASSEVEIDAESGDAPRSAFPVKTKEIGSGSCCRQRTNAALFSHQFPINATFTLPSRLSTV